ncbi:50S ribosomal protein L28 [candidate division WOR-3 bacterium]|nr:50S ribosomal protein L28 [candidate division WOR-3 bacterium]
MSRRCSICGKKGLYGSQISHSHHVTKRRQFPNLRKIRTKVDGKIKAVLVCAKCLKANKVEIILTRPRDSVHSQNPVDKTP